MKTTLGSGAEETEVEGRRGHRWSEHDIRVTRGETERGVRLGKVAGAWQRRSQHHRPSTQRDIQQSLTSRGLLKLLFHAPCSFTRTPAP